MPEQEPYLRAIGDGVRLALSIQPRASRNAFGEVLGDRRKLAVTAPPVDGKANEAITKFLAKFFGVAKSSVRIVQGETGKLKTIELQGVSLADARRLLGD